MSALKILVNGEAGAGKTELLRTLPKTTFVVSRDSKEFSIPLPHMMVDKYYSMSILLYGGDVVIGTEKVYVPGVIDKTNLFFEKTGSYPETVVFDSVSQLAMDVIDSASAVPDSYGSRGAFITAEMAVLTKFIHEELELNGVNVILLNHVIAEKEDGKPNGKYVQFGQGKFVAKGGFYSTVNESITLIPEGMYTAVHTRGMNKQARTTLTDIPTKMYVENTVEPDKSKKLKDDEYYFTLGDHLAKLLAKQENVVEEFRY